MEVRSCPCPTKDPLMASYHTWNNSLAYKAFSARSGYFSSFLAYSLMSILCCADKCLTKALWGWGGARNWREALFCGLCQFLWYKYSHHDKLPKWCQLIHKIPENVVIVSYEPGIASLTTWCASSSRCFSHPGLHLFPQTHFWNTCFRPWIPFFSLSQNALPLDHVLEQA